MKAIFLDVDGVLNFVGTDAKSPGGHRGIVDKLVDNLASVVRKTGAIIVLTSSWRHEFDAATMKPKTDEGKYLERKLRRSGLHLSSKTDDDNHNRPFAIVDWIQKHTMEGELTHWVAFDDELWLYDDVRDIAPQDFIKHMIVTSETFGLTKKNADKAIEILTE